MTRRPDPYVQDMHDAADKFCDFFEQHDAAQAKRRAEREAEERRAKTIPLGGFRHVRSETDPSKEYDVLNVNGALTCSCLGYRTWKPTRFRPTRDCKHCRMFIAGKE